MGSQPSKRSSTDTSTSTTSSSTNTNSNVHYGAELSLYTAACEVDPELRTLDTTIQQRMSRAISSLAVGVEVRALSLDSLREVTSCLLDMNQEVVKVILQCRKDIWRSPELFSLVEEYFENSLHTLDFCTALEKCLKRARDSQLIVHVALQRFEDEEGGCGDGGGGSQPGEHKHHRTLQELKSFKAAGDPFTEDFFCKFQSVHGQQLLVLEKLQLRKSKLDKKLKTIKAWRKISSAIFVSAFAAVLICSVVTAAMAAPPVAAALAAAASIPVGSMGKWIDSLWKRYQDVLKGQKEIINSMQVGSYIVIKDLDNIRALVDKLEIEIRALVGDVDFAMKGDDTAVRIAVDEIKRRLEEFVKGIEELGEQADRCSRDIRRARTVVLQKIINHSE